MVEPIADEIWRVNSLSPVCWLSVIPSPCSTPTGPAPGARISTKAVRVFGIEVPRRKRTPVDASYALIRFVSLKQFNRKAEKTWVRNAVILQDDAGIFVLKEPVNGITYRCPTAVVSIKKSTPNGTAPTWRPHLLLYGSHLACFVWSLGACTVTRDIEARRCGRRNGRHGPLDQIWPIEANEQHCRAFWNK